MDGRVEPKATDANLEGLDETQRAEVHVYEGGGPTDGLVLTDVARDHGEDFVEDDQQSEIMSEDLDTLGMTIITPGELGDEPVDDDLDAELNDDDADGEL